MLSAEHDGFNTPLMSAHRQTHYLDSKLIIEPEQVKGAARVHLQLLTPKHKQSKDQAGFPNTLTAEACSHPLCCCIYNRHQHVPSSVARGPCRNEAHSPTDNASLPHLALQRVNL